MTRRPGKILILILALIVAGSVAMTYWEKYFPRQVPPLTATLRHERNGNRYTFFFEVIDSKRQLTPTVYLPDGDEIDAPVVVITGPERVRLEELPLVYRFGGRCMGTQKIVRPKGRYTAVPRFSAPGVAVHVKPYHFTVD